MKRPQFGPAAWIMVAMLIPAGFYVWAVRGHIQQMNEQNLRDLGHAASNLQATIANSSRTVENLAVGSNGLKVLSASEVDHFENQQPYLKYKHIENICSSGDEDDRRLKSKSLVTVSSFDADLSSTSGGLAVVGRGNLGKTEEDQKKEEGQKKEKNQFCRAYEIQMDRVLDDLPINPAFEYLLIANEKGDVVLENRRGTRHQWFEALDWVEKNRDTELSTAASELRVRNLGGLPLSGEGESKFEELQLSSRFIEVRLAGRDYELFSQPIRLEVYDDKRELMTVTWVLCGLVSSRYAAAQALLASPFLTLILALVLGFGLLTWPFIKLALLTRRERFKFSDAALLVIATSWILGLSTILLLARDNSARVDDLASGDLRQLATAVKKSLFADLRKMYGQLKKYDGEFHKWSLTGEIECSEFREVANLYVPRDKPGREPSAAFALSPPEEYEDLDSSVFWVNPDGLQLAKASTRKQNTSKVSVASRSYFTEVRDGRMWNLPPDLQAVDSEDLKFYVQVFRSMTTGKFGTAVSMRSQLLCASENGDQASDLNEADKPVVAVIATPPLSMTDALLPPGIGFAVIDRSGKVLFHSDQNRALGVNLFDELEDAARLRAILLAGTDQGFETNYLTRPHELYVLPLRKLEGSRWSIVMFRDLEVMRTLKSEALTSALYWAFLVALLSQGLPALLLRVLVGRRAPWLWPDPGDLRLNWLLAAGYGALAVLAGLCLVVLSGTALIVISFAVPLVAVALFFGKWLWQRQVGADAKARDQPAIRGTVGETVRAHAVVLTMLLLLMSVMPAAGLFKVAWNDQAIRFMTYQHDRLNDQKEDRKAWTRQYYRDFRFDTSKDWEDFLTGRAKRDAKRYALTYQLEERSGDNARDSGHQGGFLDLAILKPIYNETLANVIYRDPDAEPSELEMRFGWWFAIGVCFWSIVALSWNGYAAHRLFFVGLEDEPAQKHPASILSQSSSPNVVFRVGSAGEKRQLLRMLEQPIAAVAGGGSRTPQSASRLELISDFDLATKDPSQRTEILKRLETLLAEAKRQIVIVTVSDPFESTTDPVGDTDQPDDRGKEKAAAPSEDKGSPSDPKGADSLERLRWTRVFEQFLLNDLNLRGTMPEALTEPAGRAEQRMVGLGVPDKLLWTQTAIEGNRVDDEAARQQGFFRSLWESCTVDEKLVLIHVAQEGFANPRQGATVRGLVRRGLIVRDPELRLMSPALTRFVQGVQAPNQVEQWEQAVGGFGWKQMKWVLIVILAVVAIFLAWTQSQLLDQTTGILTSLAVFVTSMLRLTAAFRGRGLAGGG
jgi:hypothetical protein